MAEAFVYCWTDHKTNKLYVGSHKGEIDDGYICSSKVMLDEYKRRPNDFTRQIIANSTVEDIRKLEYKILISINAAIDESFYNKHNGFGSYLSEDVKKKIAKTSKERWQNPDYKEKMSSAHKKRWNKTSIDEKRNIGQKISSKTKGKPKSDNHKEMMRGKRPHVNQSGSNNNNAVSIETPYGIFGSIMDAANTLNMKYDTIWYKLKNNKPGWRKFVK